MAEPRPSCTARHVLAFLLAIYVQVDAFCPPPTYVRRARHAIAASTIRSGLLFPDSQAGSSDDQRSWQKGKLSGSDVGYWWRQGDHDGEPEIALTAPAQDWKEGTLSDGRRYLWRESDDPDDPEVVMLGSTATASSSSWQIGVLASGRRYLWRGDADEPEIRLWEQSFLDSGKPFWYTSDGAVSLTDPFDLRAGYVEL